MGYSLGIDLGTTTCTVARRQGSSVEVSPVGEAGAAWPAVALPTGDGRVLVGDEADAHSIYEPPLVARHLLGRLGDGAPIDVDGHPVDALGLTAALLGAAAERAAPAPGAAPDHVVVTFPLEPGTGPEDLMSRAADVAFGATTTLVPAPVAAVARTAAVHDLGDDALVAVVDLGGATVDVALVRRTPTAFDLIGDPAVLPDLGGVDLDGAVLSLVEGAIGDVSSMVDPADGAAMLALRRLRASCRAAKERLSTETTAIVEVAMPHARGRVEITREAFERTIEPALGEAIDLVESTIDAAGLTPPDLRAVVLTGGTARIPLVTRLLTDRLGLPVLREDAPETTAALGAAMFADVDDAAGAAGPAPLADPGPPAPFPSDGGGDLAGGLAAGGLLAAGGVAAAGSADGPTDLPELAGMPDLPPIGPVTGGGPLPWDEARLATEGPGDRGGPDPFAADPLSAVPLGPGEPGPIPPLPTDPWTSGPVPAVPTDRWNSGPVPVVPADPWTDGPLAAGAPPVDDPAGAPATPDQAWGAPPDPWAPGGAEAPSADPWAHGLADAPAGDPWAPGPTEAPAADPWSGADAPWASPGGPPDTAWADPAAPADGWPAGGEADPWTTGPTAPVDDGWPAPTTAADDGWPAPTTAADDGWGTPAEPPHADPADGGDAPWGDERTSVFAGAAGAAAPDGAEWGQTSHDEVRRLTTSDTDPFGPRSGSLASRLRDRRPGDAAGDDGEAPLDRRLVIGGAIAAVTVAVAGGWLAITGLNGGDDDTIAVAEPVVNTTTSTTMATTTTAPPTTAAPTTTTTEPPTTTTERPRETTTTTAEPAPPPPPPPTTTTTTTRRPTTTTRPPTTTTTTTTTTPGPPGPPGPDN